jgi:hypothetical protein
MKKNMARQASFCDLRRTLYLHGQKLLKDLFSLASQTKPCAKYNHPQNIFPFSPLGDTTIVIQK